MGRIHSIVRVVTCECAEAKRLSKDLLVLGHPRHRYKTCERELLYSPVLRLQRGYFSCVQIAFRIDRQMVKSTELPGS